MDHHALGCCLATELFQPLAFPKPSRSCDRVSLNEDQNLLLSSDGRSIIPAPVLTDIAPNFLVNVSGFRSEKTNEEPPTPPPYADLYPVCDHGFCTDSRTGSQFPDRRHSQRLDYNPAIVTSSQTAM